MAVEWRSDNGVFLPMINDGGRNRFYKSALELKAPGKHVVDIGSGTGLLSILALKAGATHVTCVEMDPERAELTRKNLELCDLSDRATVLNANWMDIEVAGDVYVSEVLCTNIWNENLLEISEHAIARGGEFIPGRIEYQFRIYEHHPMFAICQSASEAYGFEPEIEIDPKFEEAINREAIQSADQFKQNTIFNLFNQAHQGTQGMPEIMEHFRVVHETEWHSVDLNQKGHVDYERFNHEINLKGLTDMHWCCIVVLWRAVTDNIQLHVHDTIFGTMCKVIPQGSERLRTSYNTLNRNWYFAYE